MHGLTDPSGFTIQPDGDTLIVSPASRLTDDLREAICQAKPDLMALLWAENLREHFEERAAILECGAPANHRCRKVGETLS